MKKQAGPSSVPLHTEEALNNFVNNFEASVVGEYKSCNSYDDQSISNTNHRKTNKIDQVIHLSPIFHLPMSN